MASEDARAALAMSDPHRPDADAWRTAGLSRQLLARRQLLLHGPLDGERANRLAAELMALDAESAEPVNLSINSAGGDLASLFAVVDTLHTIRAPVHVRCAGQAVGTGAALLALGTGRRRAAPHAQITLTLPKEQGMGSAADLERAADAQTALREQLFDALADATGQPRTWIAPQWERGRLLTPQEAVEEGLVDEVGG